ncbi:DUF3800 domain-containing protein [Paracoccus yeei]|uniref:DUF3800 domain-containing protein n=1 Tax=Paracoccus yeei TaxID=147645 RepID=A0A2D2C0Z2_9RHOB|nr:DUF3800 domain-containing protein [Paracoccus yeei]ATQ56178.1 hypothetical protein PYTT13_10415 [Paracoccus yeei]
MSFSDYIVFVDESGDHSLTSIDPEFPAFSLAFCIVEKKEYCEHIIPAVQGLKFKYWGHDSVVLHEHEIRKTKGDFAFLRTDPVLRANFMSDLSQVMADASFKIIASVIDKNKLVAKYPRPWSPYRLALQFCLERLLVFCREAQQANRTTHVVFECRGPAEDRDLELEFRRVVAGERNWGWINRNFGDVDFQPIFSKKSENSVGLQLADLTARPIAINVLRPQQENRAFDIIHPKIRTRKTFP